MSNKSLWEPRVSELLKRPEFVWKHKCPDVGAHGGQSKLDFYTVDMGGIFYALEVKRAKRKSFMWNIWHGAGGENITPLQRYELETVSEVANAFVLVGHDFSNRMFVFKWENIRDTEDEFVNLTTETAPQLEWSRGSRPKSEYLWQSLQLA